MIRDHLRQIWNAASKKTLQDNNNNNNNIIIIINHKVDMIIAVFNRMKATAKGNLKI